MLRHKKGLPLTLECTLPSSANAAILTLQMVFDRVMTIYKESLATPMEAGAAGGMCTAQAGLSNDSDAGNDAPGVKSQTISPSQPEPRPWTERVSQFGPIITP